MISFRNDYSEGAHPKILAALEQNNLTTTCGYSMDPFCDEARAAIRARFACPAADGTVPGFKTPTRRVEFYSERLAGHGYDALPDFVAPSSGGFGPQPQPGSA